MNALLQFFLPVNFVVVSENIFQNDHKNNRKGLPVHFVVIFVVIFENIFKNDHKVYRKAASGCFVVIFENIFKNDHKNDRKPRLQILQTSFFQDKSNSLHTSQPYTRHMTFLTLK